MLVRPCLRATRQMAADHLPGGPRTQVQNRFSSGRPLQLHDQRPCNGGQGKWMDRWIDGWMDDTTIVAQQTPFRDLG